MPITLTNGKQIENWRILFRRRLAIGAVGNIVQPLELVQLDKNLPVLAATLTVDGDSYAAPDGASYTIRVRRPDGTAAQVEAFGVDSDGIVYIEFDPTLTGISGTALASIEVSVSGGTKCTQIFRLNIARNPIPGGD